MIPQPRPPYRSVLDRAQDRLDSMGAQIEASRQDPIGAARPQVSDIALMLDTTVNMADLARGDLAKLMPRLPDTTSLWVHVDLARAIGHLRAAAVLLDKATDALEDEGAEAVTR